MNTSTKIKTVIAAFAAATTVGLASAPIAFADNAHTTADDTTNALLRACKITPDSAVQNLAVALTLDEKSVFDKINSFRTSHGVDALTFDNTVASAAVVSGQDSVLRGESPGDYIDTLGRDTDERLDDCGASYSTAGEINWWGTDYEVSKSGKEAVNSWTTNDADAEKILDPSFTKMGVALGYSGEIGQLQDSNRVHWTVVFTD